MLTTIALTKSKFKKSTILTVISVSVLLISVSSVSAQKSLKKASVLLDTAGRATSNLLPLLGEPRDEIQAGINRASDYALQAQLYTDQLSSFYYNLIAGNLAGIVGDLQAISGALGIPDPFAVRSQSEWDEQIPSGTFSTVGAKANTTDRAIVSGIARLVLGKDGQSVAQQQQQQLATIVQQSATAAGQSVTSAQEAQGRNITQDILKDVAVQQAVIAQQQTAQAQINQQMSGQLTGLQLQGAASNVMLSDISGSLDFQQSQRQVSRQAENFSEAQTAAQIFIPGIRFSE